MPAFVIGLSAEAVAKADHWSIVVVGLERPSIRQKNSGAACWLRRNEVQKN
jgi:hypothetical protein